ncbi:TonB-dependent receptor [Shinella kummerowiae]|uniref:TonB-dependent receptor n=1 Tax=Shinella kummerowiae TaxID=417745 RepID=A0A6N8S8W5_9HYPH|nr:FecR domain-containing protein [Shinella kummerowiae]MXN45113.1 TonB-dependent receptor [Shinella kummerowiae]
MKPLPAGLLCLTVAASVAGLWPASATAEPVDRGTAAAGSVIEQKMGEEVRFVDFSNWQNVVRYQNLLGGDVLRTNAVGQLAILFADRTQVRLGRNSALQVKQMTPGGDAMLNLQSGTMWARAQRGGQGLAVETPAATAAIRGTDWTLTVKGDQTSLIVLEGQVELKNDQGSVQVSQGEAAVANIGQAPQKLVIVTPDDREQMLFYLTLRDGFSIMPATPLPLDGMREEQTRVSAIPADARSADDWLILAETSLSLVGRKEAHVALAEARKGGLTRSGKARAAMLEALLAGAETRYADAARLFAEAKSGLDPIRRSIAAYGEYYARSLASPELVLTPPGDVRDPYSAVMKAYTVGFLEDIPAAIAVMREAETRFPDESSLPAIRALLAQLVNDREQMREAVNRALSIDPNDGFALIARARLAGDFESDLKAARTDLMRAAEILPNSSTVWNDLGLVEDARGDTQAAEEAMKRSIVLDPESPIGHANLAIFYLDQARMEEAKREIDLAIKADPAFNVALLARGRYHLQSGDLEKGVDDLLAASTANPGHSQSQLLLAAAYYESGAREPAAQALDNADRLDKNDPVISSMRTSIAIDDYDSEGAIRNAQEFLRRSRAQGGQFATLDANQDAGSTLNNAFRLQGLNAWGQYYGDAVFDPFEGSSYVDQSIRGATDPLTSSFLFGENVITDNPSSKSFSSFFQGLLFDPHMISSRSRSANLLRRPFFEGSIGIGTTLNPGTEGWVGELELQSYSNEPVPLSGYLNLQYADSPDKTRTVVDSGILTRNSENEQEIMGLNGYLTSTLTPDDRLVAYANHSTSAFEFNTPYINLFFPGRLYGVDTTFTTAGLGWSHTLDYRNVVNAALLFSSLDFERRMREESPPFFQDGTTLFGQKSYVAAINHVVESDNLTWRYGVEGGVLNNSFDIRVETSDIPPVSASTRDESYFSKAYLDLLHDITPELKAEYGLFGTVLGGSESDAEHIEPRAGFAWIPAEGHWLRAGYIRQTSDMTTPTLAPIGIVGLQANDFSVGSDGYSDTLALKWDAEWTDRFFTTIDYQHQTFHDLTVNDALLLSSYSFSEAEADRVAITANLALPHGFGLSATYALAFSEVKDQASPAFGRDLPFLPRHTGQVAVTYVSDANVKATLAANYVGERYGDVTPRKLDDYWTLDAELTWEPFDKNIAFEASAYNLLDEDFDVMPGFNGWGRVFKGMMKVRF